MIIELHAIQTFGPSNLNRDDTGNPKDALFGGVRRARISSQSAKRAIRVSDAFKDAVQVGTGTRTKALIEQLALRLMDNGIDGEEALELASETINATFAKPDKKDPKKTNVLVYVGANEFDVLVNYILDARASGGKLDTSNISKEITKLLKGRPVAPDIALFGRMLAEHPDLNIDAACQVAHALSTHEVNTAEFDYFTAVDDLNTNEETGAGMLGLVAFNSATYYRCVRIDWEQLLRNLHGDVQTAINTVVGMMRGMALVVPTGMQNSFVNQHAPDFLLATIRYNNDGQSLDNAFEQPIHAKKGSGYAEPSVKALVQYWEQVDRAFRLSEPVISVMNPRQYDIASDELANATQPTLNAWVHVIVSALQQEGA